MARSKRLGTTADANLLLLFRKMALEKRLAGENIKTRHLIDEALASFLREHGYLK